MTEEELKRWEGPAFACLVATLCALAIAKIQDPWVGVTYWLVFVVVSGLFIDPLCYRSTKQFFTYCMLPTGWLIFVWIALPILTVIWGGPINMDLVRSLAMLLPFVFIATAIGIPLGSLAKRPIIQVFTTDPKQVSKISNTLKAIGVLASLVLAAIVAFKSGVHIG